MYHFQHSAYCLFSHLHNLQSTSALQWLSRLRFSSEKQIRPELLARNVNTPYTFQSVARRGKGVKFKWFNRRIQKSLSNRAKWYLFPCINIFYPVHSILAILDDQSIIIQYDVFSILKSIGFSIMFSSYISQIEFQVNNNITKNNFRSITLYLKDIEINI